jgi:hypothetical protein
MAKTKVEFTRNYYDPVEGNCLKGETRTLDSVVAEGFMVAKIAKIYTEPPKSAPTEQINDDPVFPKTVALSKTKKTAKKKKAVK